MSMNTKCNSIGGWLDEHQAVAGTGVKRSDYECGFYAGAMSALDLAGYTVGVTPCGRGVIHYVYPPKRMFDSEERNDGQMKLEI